MAASPIKPNTVPNWGETPWAVNFLPTPRPIPEKVDFAIIGAGKISGRF